MAIMLSCNLKKKRGDMEKEKVRKNEGEDKNIRVGYDGKKEVLAV